jgi:hypothetical protein
MLAFAVTSVAACGGGGGGETGGGAVTVLAVLQAAMRGNLESTVIDPTARATAVLEISSNGAVVFAGTGEPGWTSDVVGLHVHRGAAGTDGPIVVDLLAASAGGFDPATHTATGSGTIDAALAAEIANDPSDFYVNVHTTGAPGGLARGQLETFTGLEVWAILEGSEESPVSDPLAHGAATVSIDPLLNVSWMIDLERPAIDDVTMAHIHVGPPGVNGAIQVDFDVPSSTVDATTGIRSGEVTTTFAMVSRLMQDPAGFYVNAHTAVAPGGVARGQCRMETAEVWAILKGSNETSVFDPNARGGMTLQMRAFTSGYAHVATPPLGRAPVGQDIGSMIGAHLHEGLAGVDGAIVADLQAGADYVVSTSTGAAEGTVVLNQSLFTRILSKPDDFYCNIHSPSAPSGLARGQLTTEPVRFAANLLGTNEVPPTDPAFSGFLHSLLVTGIFETSFEVQMVNPAVGLVQMAHIHDGVAGVNGPILVDLFGASDLTIVGDRFQGSTVFDGHLFARLMAFPEGFYCNVHTALFPGGAVRGQCERIGNDVLPTNLVYPTPQVFVTGAPIQTVIPTNLGGNITSYVALTPLPAGLTLNPTNGRITGTPTAITAAANYTIEGSNLAGSTQAVINITVNEGPPISLSYTTPVTYVKDQAITPNNPTATGGAITGYSVNPALPSGLSIHPTTGVISGTPDTLTAAANYTVTGSNGVGNAQAVVNIEVVNAIPAPSNLSYSSNPASYPTGYTITNNVPTVTGTVVSYSVNPALPTGLTLNTTTGVISGKPTAVTAAANYTVTATNGSGSTNVAVNIAITLGAPANLTYTPSIAYPYLSGNAAVSMTPSSEGGAVSSYSLVSGSLPPGVTLNTGTGVVSGTATGGAGQNFPFTVRASNATGNADSSGTAIYVYP